MKISFMRLLILCIVSSIVAQPLVTIDYPVTTPFGTYNPILSDVVPSVPDYTIAPDFSNVMNFTDSLFSPAEKASLLANGFVVVPTQHCELFDIYNTAAGSGRYVFITTDFVLHTFHKLVSHMMKGREKHDLYAKLCELSDGMRSACYDRIGESADSICLEALDRNFTFFDLPANILNGTVPSGLAGDEYDLIEDAAGFGLSPIFGYGLDYSQFIVRGNYASDDTLRKYFKSMMWYGLVSFPIKEFWFPSDSNYNDTIGTLQALMIAQILENDTALAGKWEYIYDKSCFWAGSSDDPTWKHYMDIAYRIYGYGFSTLTVNELKLHVGEFLSMAADSLPVPLIGSSSPPGMRFMGQRTNPCGIIFTPTHFSFGKVISERTRCSRRARLRCRTLDNGHFL
jgi:hypothetical protein